MVRLPWLQSRHCHPILRPYIWPRSRLCSCVYCLCIFWLFLCSQMLAQWVLLCTGPDCRVSVDVRWPQRRNRLILEERLKDIWYKDKKKKVVPKEMAYEDIEQLDNAYESLVRHGEIHVKYQNFSMRMPKFVDRMDEKVFNRSGDNMELLNEFGTGLKYTRGVIKLIPDGIFIGKMSCGWNSNLDIFERRGPSRRKSELRVNVKVICPLVTEQSYAFQHFLDGAIPKFMQVYEFLRHPNVSLLVYPRREFIISDIMNNLVDHSQSKVLEYHGMYVHTDYQVNTCITPPMHPVLWRKFRDLLQIPTKHPPEWTVVLLSRAIAVNKGRNIVNFDEVKNYLENRFGATRVRVFRGMPHLQETRSVFESAHVIIGVHGGGLYNMLFAPPNTTVIEVLPVDGTGQVVPGYLAQTIFWQMASTIGHNFWRMYEYPENSQGNVKVALWKLAAILNTVSIDVL